MRSIAVEEGVDSLRLIVGPGKNIGEAAAREVVCDFVVGTAAPSCATNSCYVWR